MAYDHRKASYAACLDLWRRPDGWDSAPGREPLPEAFGLSPEEAQEVEDHGYLTEGLPQHLQPRPRSE